MRRTFAVALTALSLFGAGALHAQSQRISGEVFTLDGPRLTIKSNSGQETTVMLAETTRISVRSPVSLAQIAPGAYVGAMSVPQPDGTLLVTAIQVFPENARGTGEGHRPMDSDPGNTMTNATVANVAASNATTMTNATVANVAGSANARRVTVTYKGGEQILVIPDTANAFTSTPGDRSTLVPGAHLSMVVRTNSDGALGVERISVGKDGYVPLL